MTDDPLASESRSIQSSGVRAGCSGAAFIAIIQSTLSSFTRPSHCPATSPDSPRAAHHRATSGPALERSEQVITGSSQRVPNRAACA